MKALSVFVEYERLEVTPAGDGVYRVRAFDAGGRRVLELWVVGEKRLWQWFGVGAPG